MRAPNKSPEESGQESLRSIEEVAMKTDYALHLDRRGAHAWAKEKIRIQSIRG